LLVLADSSSTAAAIQKKQILAQQAASVYYKNILGPSRFHFIGCMGGTYSSYF
jgi:hypothetical protein